GHSRRHDSGEAERREWIWLRSAVLFSSDSENLCRAQRRRKGAIQPSRCCVSQVSGVGSETSPGRVIDQVAQLASNGNGTKFVEAIRLGCCFRNCRENISAIGARLLSFTFFPADQDIMMDWLVISQPTRKCSGGISSEHNNSGHNSSWRSSVA